MKPRVLVSGGAGFIGSHTCDLLLKKGYKVRILDNLSSKTHSRTWPKYLDKRIEKVKGDVRNKKDWTRALQGVSSVIHLAAWMDLIPDFSKFFSINVTGTANLYEAILKNRLPVKKVIVASSQFVYGQGKWKCDMDGVVYPKDRADQGLKKGIWDPKCPECAGKVTPLPNSEDHQDPPNQYAISKYTQELIALKLGRLNNIPSVAMRYCIVHGPRQSLKNVYSGALRIFTLQLLSGRELTIYEDGNSLRDFTSVYDVARANVLALESDKANFENFNVGSGKAYTVLELAHMIAKALGKDAEFKPTGEFRTGDIRHAVSDISKLKKLGWKVEDSEEKIVKEYIDWVKTQKLNQDYLTLAEKQMKELGVIRKLDKSS